MFGDTLISGTNSNLGNKYAEVFETNFGWTRAFSTKNKSEDHEDLSLMFQSDGVTPRMIVDGFKISGGRQPCTQL